MTTQSLARARRATLGLVVALFALSGAATARAQGEQITPEARAHFTAGVNLLRDPSGARYEEAYREFQQAYSLSKSPRILGNLGLCAMKLERDAEAIEAYSRYLAEAPDIDTAEREQIERDLATLKMGVVRVNVHAEPKDAVLVDVRQPVRGEAVRNVYNLKDGSATLGLRPGHHVIVARASQGESAPWEFDAAPGSTLNRTLTVQSAQAAAPAPSVMQPAQQTNVMPWVVTGVGAAALVAGGVTGALALKATSDIEANCPQNNCNEGYDLEANRSSAQTLVTATDILLIGGGVVTAGGLTWLLLSGNRSEEQAPSPAASARAGSLRPASARPTSVRLTSLRPSFVCAPGTCGASLSGRF